MTYEQKLKSIIEAQVKGGYEEWELFDGAYLGKEGWIEDNGMQEVPVIAVLLDTEGAKASYGEGREVTPLYSKLADGTYQGTADWKWSTATEQVLFSWHSGKGNNWKAAIDTAYDLLPKNR